VRNIALFILFLIGLFYVRRALRGGQKPTATPQPGAPEPSRAEACGEIEQMVPCAHCGLHVPESEGVRGAGGFFCSEEHRRLGPRR
jgi:uncharacterized protein